MAFGKLSARMRSSLFRALVVSALLVTPIGAAAQTETAVIAAGASDFDCEIGAWTTHLRRLRSPLSNSTEWIEYEGTSLVRPVLNGRANLVELSVAGGAGRIEGASWRLYNPEARQWSLNFANARDGLLTPPLYGAFANGRGEFYGADTLNGRAILVRFVISDITANSARFEQAFSADGGKSWEVNWIAVDTRRR